MVLLQCSPGQAGGEETRLSGFHLHQDARPLPAAPGDLRVLTGRRGAYRLMTLYRAGQPVLACPNGHAHTHPSFTRTAMEAVDGRTGDAGT